MKRSILLFLLLAVLQISFAQKVYFIYLQSEQEQPFFVKLNDKVYSSTTSGYLILSKLHDSTYYFDIGFAQNKWPEQKFSVTINKKDHGYLLKNFGEKGWGLFDLQTLAVQMAIPPVSNNGTAIKTEKKQVSEFTEILSRAADDSTLRETQILVKEEKKPAVSIQDIVKKEENKADVKAVVESKESTVAKDETAIKKEDNKPDEKTMINSEEQKIEKKDKPEIKKEESQAMEQPYKRSVVIRKSESSTTAGLGLIFIDDYQNGYSDTISILIPNPKPLLTAVKEEPQEEKKFLNITSDTAKKENENLQLKKEEKTTADQKIKNNCQQIAEENDFLTLRKNMAAKNNDDEMMDEAKKYFKTKCFTSLQIRNLSVLFLNDGGKYNFFDLAYNYVSDPDNFSSLQSELKDEYYINRFKAMIRLL